DWRTASDVTELGLLATSLAVPAFKGDWDGMRQAATSDALAGGSALLLKSVIREERPNGEDHHSFPSAHTAFAFAAATTLTRRYGWKYGAVAYPLAAFTGVARGASRKHHWWDVVAGAALGVGSGWLMTHPFQHRVRVAPWVGEDALGVVVVARW